MNAVHLCMYINVCEILWLHVYLCVIHIAGNADNQNSGATVCVVQWAGPTLTSHSNPIDSSLKLTAKNMV